jgi:hypothetical protein
MRAVRIRPHVNPLQASECSVQFTVSDSFTIGIHAFQLNQKRFFLKHLERANGPDDRPLLVFGRPHWITIVKMRSAAWRTGLVIGPLRSFTYMKPDVKLGSTLIARLGPIDLMTSCPSLSKRSLKVTLS